MAGGEPEAERLGFIRRAGNVYTWCQESTSPIPRKGDKAVEDKEDDLVIVNALSRVLRGGSFVSQASIVRSSYRNNDVPTNRYSGLSVFVRRGLLRLDFFTALPLPEGTEGDGIDLEPHVTTRGNSRNHRFVLRERIERNLYDLLEILIRAKYTRNRQELLDQANLVLEILRLQMRLAKDLQCLKVESYGFAAKAIDKIGKRWAAGSRAASHETTRQASKGMFNASV